MQHSWGGVLVSLHLPWAPLIMETPEGSASHVWLSSLLPAGRRLATILFGWVRGVGLFFSFFFGGGPLQGFKLWFRGLGVRVFRAFRDLRVGV